MAIKRTGLIFAAVAFFSIPVFGADWPDIPKTDWDLTAVPGHPNAAAVVLLREGTVELTDRSLTSHIEVYTRIKVLTEEGADYGSISLVSNDYMRTKKLEGRTHLPDGKVVELPDDATFKKEYSDYYGSAIVSCTMPEVAPGAIIEYRYRVYFDSISYQRMWYFQAEIPTLLSRVAFNLPRATSYRPLVYRTLPNIPITEDVKETATGGVVTYTMKNAPPVPDEPLRFPFADLAARVMFLPTARRVSSGVQPIFESWDSAVDLAWGYRDYGYTEFMNNAGSVKKKAKSLASAEESKRARADAVYRFVRDEIETYYAGDVWIIDDREADKVMSDKQADLTEKALLLHVMLDAIKIDSTLVWVNPRNRGRVEQEIANANQFFRVLVAADIEGEQVFLDPTERTNAFGCLEPDLQGVPALLVTKKKQEWTTTPQLSASESARDAHLVLSLDEEGRLSGTGEMAITGVHALRRLEWKDTREESIDAWTGWLESSFDGFDIKDFELEENIESCSINISWAMMQRDEDVLGDEATFPFAEPLAIASNPLTLPPHQRRTPVQLGFPDTDRVRLEISWPEGWVLDGPPELPGLSNAAGTLNTVFNLDEEKRTLSVRRELIISKTEYFGPQEYGALANLYRTAVSNDAEEILLLAQ